MKLRHAATLALVGWYLMLPPVSSISGNLRDMDGPWSTNIYAKLNDWNISESFDNAPDCEIERGALIKDFAKH